MFSLATLRAELDKHWAFLKFLGFGCYYAWIWLCYDSTVLVPSSASDSATGDSIYTMYIASTAALAIVLLALAFTAQRSRLLLERPAVVLGAGLLASLSTVLIVFATARGGSFACFIVASVLTGVGTAFVALRLGMLYSTLPARQVVMHTAASFVCACMLYFVGAGLPHLSGAVFCSTLPFAAALLSISGTPAAPDPVDASSQRAQSSRRPQHGFFLRFIMSIFLFSLLTGVTRGYAALYENVSMLGTRGAMIASGMGLLAAVLFIAIGMLKPGFNVSRLYYPAVVIAALGMVAAPLLFISGAFELSAVYEGQLIGIAYALFIFMVWCLCAYVSRCSSISAVKVFGWGRGTSAAGTTIGWLVGSALLDWTAGDSSLLASISIAMAFILLVTAMLVFNGHTFDELIARAGDEAEGPGMKSADARDMDAQAEGGNVERQGKRGRWSACCDEVAEEHMLTAREREVMFLLAKGRTIDHIGQKLDISVNTAKTHVRNVYAKLGVHTRQELLDMVERRYKR